MLRAPELYWIVTSSPESLVSPSGSPLSEFPVAEPVRSERSRTWVALVIVTPANPTLSGSFPAWLM